MNITLNINTTDDPIKIAEVIKILKDWETRYGGLPTKEDFQAMQPTEMPEPIIKFVDTGDISIIQAVPNHRDIYRNVLFLQVNNISGRTLRGMKHSGAKYREYVGVLPPYFTDEVISVLKQNVEEKGEINVVVLDNGEKPGLVLDMLTVEKDWSVQARMFNTLWRNPK